MERSPGSSQRQYLDRRFDELWAELGAMRKTWIDLGEFILPTRHRSLMPKGSKSNASRRNGRIIDSTATQSYAVAKAGMLSGMASPHRPWFMLTLNNKDLARNEENARWLEDATTSLLDLLERSNFYNQLEMMFGDELVFGTSAMGIFEDEDKTIRCQTFPIGSFAIAQDAKGVVDTFVREIHMTLRQAADEYGLDKLSQTAQNSFEKGRESGITVRHAILRNNDYDAERGESVAKHRRWKECYWEVGGSTSGNMKNSGTPNWSASTAALGEGELLREGGYHEFPIIVGRWERTTDEVYGTNCPGMMALGDIKQLQAMERTALNALNKMVDPPLVGGPGIANKDVSLMSGAVTVDGGMNGQARLQPIHEVRFPIDQLEAKQHQVRERIKRAFMEHIFLMLLNDQRNDRATAREIEERSRERLSILGPVLERHSDDVFDPAIDRVAQIAMRRSMPGWETGEGGLIPPPPEQMQGQSPRIEYVSEVARAQKRVGLSAMENYAMAIMNAAGVVPQILDNVDWDFFAQHYAKANSLPERLTRPDEERDGIRQTREQAQQAAQQQQAIPAMAGAAKDMSETQVNGGSALDQMIASAGAQQ